MPLAPEHADALSRVAAFCLDGESCSPCTRSVIREEPLRLVLNGAPVGTLMRTPGDEADLAVGFLLTEGLIRSAGEVVAVSFCPEGELGNAGEVQVRLTGPPQRTIRQRHADLFSSCSLCGLEMIEAYADDLAAFARPAPRLTPPDIHALRDAMDAGQTLFRETGASHAAALAEPPCACRNLAAVMGEDLGRHNALDKAVGKAARQGLPLERCLLLLSGRLSFEMVAKAARAGVSDVAAVGAPSALGVALARRLNMFLAGFARGQKMTVYSGVEALQTGSPR